MAEEKNFNPDDYWEKRLTKKKGLEGVGYARLGRGYNKWAYKVRKHVFKKLVNDNKIDASKSQVLDIGSGSGFYINAWRELGSKDITGVDLTQIAVEDLKRDLPYGKFFQCDIGDPDFNKDGDLKKYDLISCMDVLFHIVDDQRFENAIKNISSLLNPGGSFIYSDNFLHGEVIRYKHQACRTKEYLYKVFAEHGLEITVRKPFMYLTNTPIDSKNIFLKFRWFWIENLVSRLKFLGWPLGMGIYPFEILLVDNCKESPSTEIVLSRKK